jgi:hypothetical protein
VWVEEGGGGGGGAGGEGRELSSMWQAQVHTKLQTATISGVEVVGAYSTHRVIRMHAHQRRNERRERFGTKCRSVPSRWDLTSPHFSLTHTHTLSFTIKFQERPRGTVALVHPATLHKKIPKTLTNTHHLEFPSHTHTHMPHRSTQTTSQRVCVREEDEGIAKATSLVGETVLEGGNHRRYQGQAQ